MNVAICWLMLCSPGNAELPVVGNPRVAYLYGDVSSLPVAFFVDRDQRVAAIHLGAANRKDCEKAIQILLEGAK